jgi:hypothetical protein
VGLSPLWRRELSVGLTTLVVVSACTALTAQNVTEPSLKAAFLYSFAKFAEWPAGLLAADGSLVFCVLGDAAVGNALDQTLKGHTVEGHGLVVSRVEADGPLRSCHLLYVSGLTLQRTTQLLERLNGAPVFTISDLDRFAQRGGIAHFFIENGTMRFAINVEAAQRAHLRLSSKLLGLARIVKED